MIRHGQSEANRDSALDTAHPGTELTEVGRRQAEAIPAALADRAIDAIYASPTHRTRGTAAPLARALSIDPIEHAGLLEIQAGDVEMSTDAAEARGYLAVIDRWVAGDLNERMPGAETGAEFLSRFDAALSEIAASGAGTAAVFGHGGACYIWAHLRTGTLSADPRSVLTFSNTGMLEVEGDPVAGWRVASVHRDALGGPAVSSEGADSPFEIPEQS